MKRKIIIVVIFVILYQPLLSQIEIPLKINDGGYLFVEVKINDKASAVFMLDTGAGINVVSSDLFDKIESSLKKAGLHTGTRHNGETITGMLYTVPTLSIGSIKKNNVVIGKFDGLTNCDGLISMDYFRDIPFTIDFINKKLIFETKESMTSILKFGGHIPIHLKTNGKNELDFFVKICINDSISANAEFDTGAGAGMLMLNTKYLRPLQIDLNRIPKQDYGYYVYSTTLKKLQYCNLKGVEQHNVFVGFKDPFIYEALIGSGMFKNKKLTIDIAKSEMWVRE